MKIENLRIEHVNQRTRVAATIAWEDQERPAFEMYFETDKSFAPDLTCNPHAFLIACIMPAFYYGEQRIRMDAPIDPELLDGMQNAMGWVRHWWFDPDKRLVTIEAPTNQGAGNVQKGKRVGMFFSGGIDSLAALRTNRKVFGDHHPRHISDGLIVFGLETDREESFRHVLSTIAEPARDADLTLIPIYTNARLLEPDWMFWERYSHDAVLASIAYSLSNRFSEVAISSTYDIPSVQPAGTHPLLDLAYSSSELMIRHESLSLSRFEKVKLICEWDIAFQNIRVCNKSQFYSQGQLNCGECIKCVRTMLELEALGLLDNCRAFPSHTITPELLAPAVQIYRTTVDFYEALIQPLKAQNREDLAASIQKKIDTYYKKSQAKDISQAFKAIAKRMDQKYLNGRILKRRKIRKAKAAKQAGKRTSN